MEWVYYGFNKIQRSSFESKDLEIGYAIHQSIGLTRFWYQVLVL